MWECYSKTIPFPGCSLKEIITKVVELNERPEIPFHCPIAVKETITACWAKEPENRPTAKQILQKLEPLMRQQKVNHTSHLSIQSDYDDE